jgi:hypothetical protein
MFIFYKIQTLFESVHDKIEGDSHSMTQEHSSTLNDRQSLTELRVICTMVWQWGR